MSDDRLFASNNAIGRKGYIINLITLAALTYATNRIFVKSIFPFVTDEVYFLIAKILFFFLMIVYSITLLALVDRRIYDVCGKRDCALYKNLSGTFNFFVIVLVIVLVQYLKNFKTIIPQNILEASGIFSILALAFIIFVLSFLKGKISNMTFDNYKKKDKYD